MQGGIEQRVLGECSNGCFPFGCIIGRGERRQCVGKNAQGQECEFFQASGCTFNLWMAGLAKLSSDEIKTANQITVSFEGKSVRIVKEKVEACPACQRDKKETQQIFQSAPTA